MTSPHGPEANDRSNDEKASDGNIEGDTDLVLKIVTPSGEIMGEFVSACGETVEQFVERFGSEASPAECVVLLHGDRVLLPNLVLQDCGIQPGATLTLLREHQSQLQLTAYCSGYLAVGFSWMDETSPASQFCSLAEAWCRKFVDKNENPVSGISAVCSLQNPGSIQRQVDSQALSKTEAVQAILSCFVRSLLASGRIGQYGEVCEWVGEASENEAVTAMLREHLPNTACGTHLLSNVESQVPERFADLSERYLKYVRENNPDGLESFMARVRDGLADTFKLEPLEEMRLTTYRAADGQRVGWRRCLELHAGSDKWCDTHCTEGWINFLKTAHRPENMWFQIQYYGDPACRELLEFSFGVGVYLEGEEVEPNQLPSHYMVGYCLND